MNKAVLIFLLFIYALVIHAKENNLVIRGTMNIPLEFNLLLEGLQPAPLPQQEFELLKQQITRIESYALNMTKEEIFFITKAAFYKSFLIFQKNNPKNYFDATSIMNISSARQKTNDSFLKWFFTALEKDALSINNLPLYQDYLNARSLGKLDKIELKKIDRKVQLVSWWITKISADIPELIWKEIKPLLIEILNKIEVSFYLMANLSKATTVATPLKYAPLTFFLIEELKNKLPTPAPLPTVNDIIDSTESNDSLKLPSPSSEDWLLPGDL
jgi:hypothetical protein